jgi:hypothetical protein
MRGEPIRPRPFVKKDAAGARLRNAQNIDPGLIFD